MIPNMRILVVLAVIVATFATSACMMGGGADESAFGGMTDSSASKEADGDRGFAAGATAPAMAPAAEAFDEAMEREETAVAQSMATSDSATSLFRPEPPAAPALPGGGDDTSVDQQVAELVSQQRIIVRTVDMTIEVAAVSASVDAIGDMATEMGGWVVSSNRSQKHRGSVSVRVPADRLDEAIQRLRDLGVDVKSEVTSSRDVTDEYVDSTSRLKTLRATEEALLALMEKAEKVEEALQVRDSLTVIQQEIERHEGRIKFLEQTSAFSLVNVTLELEPVELSVDAGGDQTTGIGQSVRFRASFKPPEGMEEHTFTWDFGDGSRPVTSNRTAPTEDEETRVTATMTHFYEDEKDSPFIAQIEMMSTGEAGVAEGEDTIMVNVTRIPVIEVFAGEQMIVDEGEELEFDGSFTRPEGLSDVRFRWDFGDGTIAEEGNLAEGTTRAVVTHIYSDHRPFDYTAKLTITADSAAGEVEASSAANVRVRETEGWTIAGWSAGDRGKEAVRALSGLGQGIGTILIWLLIFSPAIAVIGVAVGVPVRRYRRRKRS